jgi:hypothetical protein
MTPQEFLRFWQDQSKSNGPMAAEDVAQKLAVAHVKATQKLATLKAQGVSFIVPGKDSRGRWVPIYDDARVGDIATLGSEIEQAGNKIKSVSNDIIAFLELSEGKPMLSAIVHEREQLRRRILATEKHAAAALKKALDKDPHTSPAVLMQRADIAEAYSAMNKAKEETEKPLADLDERLGKMREILDRYAV